MHTERYMITYYLFVQNLCRLRVGFGHGFECSMFACALMCAPPLSGLLVRLHALNALFATDRLLA
jgi:hypothetical protein